MTLVLHGARQLVGVAPPGQGPRRGTALRDPGLVPAGAVVVEGETISWVGPESDLPPLPPDAVVHDLGDRVLVPGFVDSHTHLLFAGDRVAEWEERLAGVS